jgi:hypothetical protein
VYIFEFIIDKAVSNNHSYLKVCQHLETWPRFFVNGNHFKECSVRTAFIIKLYLITKIELATIADNCYKIHTTLGLGLLESVYEGACL